MKKHITSFSILFALLSIFAFGHIEPMVYAESSSSTVEYVVEDRVAEKDTKLAFDDVATFTMIIFNMFQKTVITSCNYNTYNFELKNTLFRPPILL